MALPMTMGQQPQQMPPQAPQWVDPYAEQRAALAARMQQEMAPMFSPEEAAQRVAQNTREWELGLLGSMSGHDSLAGVGGTVLKNALANRQPRVSERGTADPLTGKFTYSPDYLRSQQQGQLDKLDAQSAASRAAFDKERREAQDRKDLQEARYREMKVLKSLGGGGGGVGPDEARVWSAEDRLADDFDRETKTARLVLSAHRGLQAIAQRTDAASDIAFIFSYMKMLDPTSVVREGEFANAQNSAGVPDQVRNAYNRAMTGVRLNAAQRRDMLGTAERLAREADRSIGSTAEQFREKARRRRLNPDNIAIHTPMPAPARAAPPVIDVGATMQPQQPKPAAVPRAPQVAPSAVGGGNQMIDAGW